MIRTLSLLLVSASLAAAKKPNIVIVITDDMGYSDIGCYGGEIPTPNIDALAAGGVRFTNFYVNNMCVVTRISLMTGQYPKIGKPGGVLAEDCTTLPEALRSAGYTTLMAGKWHLGRGTGEGSPMGRGFDHWYGIPGGASSFFDPFKLTRDGKDVQEEAQDPDYYFTDALTDESVRMVTEALDEDADRPFFLYLAYTAAHWPLHAREADIAKHKGRFDEGWDALREKRHKRMREMGIIDERFKLSPRHPDVPSWEEEQNKAWQQRRMEVYAAQVQVMDEGVGRLVGLLEARGELDNTIVLYMHDNGACHVEYGKNRKGDYLPEKTRDGRPMRPGNLPEIMPGPEDTYGSIGYGWANLGNTPFRLFKQHDHEGGDRSPLVMHWPAGIEAKGALDRSVSHVTDLMPTLLEAAGVDYPKDKRQPIGRSFAAAFEGGEVADRESIFWGHARGRAARVGNWKLVSEAKGAWELYDLAKDPTELENLASSEKERAAELGKRWQAWQKAK